MQYINEYNSEYLPSSGLTIIPGSFIQFGDDSADKYKILKIEKDSFQVLVTYLNYFFVDGKWYYGNSYSMEPSVFDSIELIFTPEEEKTYINQTAISLSVLTV